MAPRPDLPAEILMARVERRQVAAETKTIIPESPSDEASVSNGCWGKHYLYRLRRNRRVALQFSYMEKVTVLDGVTGNGQTTRDKAVTGTLQQGEILPNSHDNQIKL